MYYPPGAVSTDSTEANPIEIFFINNGLPWTQAIEKFLSKKGFKNVELLKLLKDDEWDNLFVNEKIVQKRLASVVFKDLQADSLKAPKCVTQTPLKSHDSEPTPLKTNKRKGGTVSGNDASHKLFRYYQTIPKNKPPKQPGSAGAASCNSYYSSSGTGTRAANAGSREDAADAAADAGAGGAGDFVTDIVVNSAIYWNFGKMDRD